jgi:hypothetical protein
MGSAIQTLQKAILDPNQSPTLLLRHTKLIASKLNLENVGVVYSESSSDAERSGFRDPHSFPLDLGLRVNMFHK